MDERGELSEGNRTHGLSVVANTTSGKLLSGATLKERLHCCRWSFTEIRVYDIINEK
jgi:hypothetical protein